MKIKDKIKAYLPHYALLPLSICVLINVLVYYGGRLLTSGWYHYNFSLPLDDKIPFVPAMIVIYMLSFPFWVICFILISKESPKVCFEVLAGEQIAKLLCLIFFLALPTTLVRPTVTGSSIFDWLIRMTYHTDEPNMLFPSIHCMESWICFRGALRCKSKSRNFKVFCLIAALLIFLSTLMTRQHVFLDVPGGIAVAELGLQLSRLTHAGRIYGRQRVNAAG